MLAHAATVEYVLVSVASLGVFANILMLRAAILAQGIIEEDDESTYAERIVVTAVVRQETLRLGKQSIIWLVAVCSILLAPPPPQLRDAAPQIIVSMFGYIVVSMLMTLTSLSTLWHRRELARLIEKKR